jgi:hypothetical protein
MVAFFEIAKVGYDVTEHCGISPLGNVILGSWRIG